MCRFRSVHRNFKHALVLVLFSSLDDQGFSRFERLLGLLLVVATYNKIDSRNSSRDNPIAVGSLVSQGNHVVDLSGKFLHNGFCCLQRILHGSGALGDFTYLGRHFGGIPDNAENSDILAVNLFYDIALKNGLIFRVNQIGGYKWEVLLFGQSLQEIQPQNQIQLSNVDGIDPDLVINLRDQFCLELGRLLDRIGYFLIFVEQVARIHDHKPAVILPILFQICSFFSQPTELCSGIGSAAWFEVSHHVAAIGDRNSRAFRRARAVHRNPD